MWLVGALACTGDRPDRPDPEPTPVDHSGTTTDDPTGLLAARPTLEDGSGNVRLAQRLLVSTTTPTTVTVTLDDGVRRRRLTVGEAEEHEIPLLELHEGRDHVVDVHVSAADGREVDRRLTFRTEPIDFVLPSMTLLASDGAEPGLRVFPVGNAGATYYIVAVDVNAEVVWVLRTGADTKALSWDPAGRWSFLERGDVTLADVFGRVTDRWAGDRDLDEGDVAVPVETLHHEVVRNADGSFWSFHKTARLVPDYPTSLLDLSQREAATIDDDHVVRVEADGRLSIDVSLADLLDPTRITVDSLATNPSGAYDWAHANGIAPVPGSDSIVVSMRHQDAVIQLDPTTGELEWILANPDGWPAELEALRLQPVGDVAWPYHQHGPWIDARGHLWLFDNGNGHRTTPYSDDPVPVDYSRLVEYEIDATARTVRQVAAYLEGSPPLFAKALGNADVLPATGHVFGTFAYLGREGGVANEEVGAGEQSVRLIEADLAAGTRHWDLRLWTATAVDPTGCQVDRAVVVPTLYPEHVATEWLD
jgi:hypothetical protein